MVCVYCDRCKGKCETAEVAFYDKAQKMNVGDYICSVSKVEKAPDDDDRYSKRFPNEVIGVDICGKCQKELNELVSNFMSAK